MVNFSFSELCFLIHCFLFFYSITCLGEAKIIEVSHKIKRGYHEIKNDPNPEGTEAKKKDLKEKKVQLERDIEQLHHTIGLLEKETKFLSSFGERLGPNDKVTFS